MPEQSSDNRALILGLTSNDTSALMSKTLRKLAVQQLLLAFRGTPNQADVEELLDNLTALIIAHLWDRLQVGKGS